MTARLTPRERAARLYDRGATTREIAEQLDVNPKTVWQWLASTDGVEMARRGPRGRTDVASDLILELRDVEQLSWQEIADTVHMSKTGVRSRYAAAKGQPRPR